MRMSKAEIKMETLQWRMYSRERKILSDWCLEVPSGNSVVATVYYVRRCCLPHRGKLSCT
jgi:hypothetical protein